MGFIMKKRSVRIIAIVLASLFILTTVIGIVLSLLYA